MTKLKSTASLNQFKQSGFRGREDEKLNLNKISVKLILNNDEQVLAGDMIKLCPGYNGGISTACLVSADEVRGEGQYGFVPMLRRTNAYENGDIATMDMEGTAMDMIASQPINCGDIVYYDNRNIAVSGMAIFKDLLVSKFKLITSGSLDLLIDGNNVNLTNLNFSSCNTLGDVAGIINTALSTNGSCLDIKGRLVIKSSTTGVDSNVVVLTDAGSLYEALNVKNAQYIEGKVAEDNQGKVFAYSGVETPGLIKCGIALNGADAEGLVRVLIK